LIINSNSSWILDGGIVLSEKDIMRFLQVLGLSKREIQVYMFLAKSGVQSTSFVAKRLKMERVQAYRTFKKLQEKGFIEATLERPTRFTIVGFSVLVDNYITAKKTEVTNLSEQKQSLLTAWQAISAPESEYPVAKFSIITGKKKIHSKMLNMIEEAKSEVIVLTTALGLIQEDIAGIFDGAVEPSQSRGVQVQILTDVSLENYKVVERLERSILEDKLGIKLRHVTMNSKFFPRFLIKDEEEAILYAPFGNEASVLNLEDEGLWINDKMFISVLKAFFVQMWQSAVDATKRIEELKSGVPLGETIVIKDPAEAEHKVVRVLEDAQKEIVVITSSQSINRLAEDDPLIKYFKSDLKIRLTASIDLDNLEPAQKLATHYEVKHVPISYLTMMLIDKKHLFMFKNPPLSDVGVESAFYLADTFYSSDREQVERVSEMLDDIWKRGIDITEITRQAGTKLPTIEIEKTKTTAYAVEQMLKNNTTSILITEHQKHLGVINDRDILREIIEEHKNPQTTPAGELKFTPIILLEADQSMIYAMQLMAKQGIQRAAIVKDNQLIGMLTQQQPPQSQQPPQPPSSSPKKQPNK